MRFPRYLLLKRAESSYGYVRPRKNSQLLNKRTETPRKFNAAIIYFHDSKSLLSSTIHRFPLNFTNWIASSEQHLAEVLSRPICGCECFFEFIREFDTIFPNSYKFHLYRLSDYLSKLFNTILLSLFNTIDLTIDATNASNYLHTVVFKLFSKYLFK